MYCTWLKLAENVANLGASGWICVFSIFELVESTWVVDCCNVLLKYVPFHSLSNCLCKPFCGLYGKNKNLVRIWGWCIQDQSPKSHNIPGRKAAKASYVRLTLQCLTFHLSRHFGSCTRSLRLGAVLKSMHTAVVAFILASSTTSCQRDGCLHWSPHNHNNYSCSTTCKLCICIVWCNSMSPTPFL